MYETTYEKSPKSYPSMSDVTTNDEKILKTVPVESKKGHAWYQSKNQYGYSKVSIDLFSHYFN